MKNKLIKRIIEVCYNSNEGHIPSSLSILDILLVLYKNFILENKNHFILSKGHASLGLYSVLEYFNLLEEPLDNFCKFDSKLGGHPSNKIKNVESSTGSLGHGLPIAVGMALGEKINKSDKKVYVIIGDGESNEGTIWESALLASNHKLNNLYCILDYNHSNDRALIIGDMKKKLESFDWECVEIDGHNHEEIFNSLTIESDKPIFIIANTIKGKGCNMMENNPEWHHKMPNEDEYLKIINNLSIDEKTIS
jgi:transketolase